MQPRTFVMRVAFAILILVVVTLAGAWQVESACAAPNRGDYVVIVLDDSGSMNDNMKGTRGRRIEAAKKALAQVVQQIGDGTQVGLLLLNGARNSNHWLIPLGPLNKADAVAKINRLAASGGTPLGDALRIAADELLRVSRGMEQPGSSRGS
jgi:Ca-activated chloride channel homolog